MKYFATLCFLLVSSVSLAYTDCFSGPDQVPLWVKFPLHSLTVISICAFCLYLICLPVKVFLLKTKIKFPLLELFLLTLYAIWFWVDLEYRWSDHFMRTTTFKEHIAVFVAYFFLIYRYYLVPWFTKIAASHFSLLLSFIIFLVVTSPFYLDLVDVECGLEYLQVYPFSHFFAVFAWVGIAWLLFSRSWRVLIASLPLSFFYFYFARQVSFFTSGKYYISDSLRLNVMPAVKWENSEKIYLAIYFFVFLSQLIILYVVKHKQIQKKV